MVTCCFFASVRDAAGRERVEREWRGPLSISDLLAALGEELPSLAPWLSRQDLLVAVNQEYRERDHIVEDGDEVALIPPVSGG